MLESTQDLGIVICTVETERFYHSNIIFIQEQIPVLFWVRVRTLADGGGVS